MFDHLGLPVSDLERSRAFYSAALAPLGIGELMEFEGAVAFGADRPQFWIVAGEPDVARVHVAFAATTRLVVSAGLSVSATRTRVGSARFDSVDEFVAIEIKGTPVGAAMDDAVYARILADAREALARFAAAGDTLVLPIEGHLIVAHRP